MRSMKRILSLLLVLCMVFAMVPSFAAAAEGTFTVATFKDTNGTETAFGYKDNGDGTYSLTKNEAEVAAADITAVDPNGYYINSDLDRVKSLAFVLAMKMAIDESYKGALTLDSDVKLYYAAANGYGVGATGAIFANTTADANLVINLNGHTLDASACTTDARFFNIYGGNVTINGGMAGEMGLDANGNAVSGFGNGKFVWYKAPFDLYEGTGTLTVNGATLEQKDTTSAFFRLRGKKANAGLTVVFNGGRMTAPAIASLFTPIANNISAHTFELKGGFTFYTNGGAASTTYANGDGTIAFIGNKNANGADAVLKVYDAIFFLEKHANVEAGNHNSDEYISLGYKATLKNGAIAIVKPEGAVHSAEAATLTIGGNSVDGVKHTIGVPKVYYNVTISAAEHGTVTANKTQASAGDVVVLTITPDEGYKAKPTTVTTEGGNSVTVTNNTFVMPAEAVTVTVEFVELQPHAINVTQLDHGTVTADRTTAKKGDTVTLTIEPADYYFVNGITVVGASGPVDVTDNAFVMPDEEVTVTVELLRYPDNYSKVHVKASEHGTVSVERQYYQTDEEVSLIIEPETGYMLDSITVKTEDGSSVLVTDNTFVVPEGAGTITVTASFQREPVVSYFDGTSEVFYYLGATADPEHNIYTNVEDAFEAAYDLWDLTGGVDAPATPEIHLHQDIEVTRCYDSSTTTIVMQVGANSKLILDLEGNTLSIAKNYGGFNFNNSNTGASLTIQNGTVNWGASTRWFITGGTTDGNYENNSTITLKDLTYSGTSRPVSFLCNLSIILDGGTFNLKGNGFNGLQSANGAIDGTGNVTLKNGVQINTTNSYAFRLPAEGHLYIEDAVVKTGSNLSTIDSGYGIAVKVASATDSTNKTEGLSEHITLGSKDGRVFSAVSGTLNTESIYNSATVYTKAFALLGDDSKTPDHVALMGERYYTLDSLVELLPIVADGIEIVFLKDVAASDVTFETNSNVTYDFGSYNVTASFAASKDFTIKGGTVNLSNPIALTNNAVLTVAENAVLDASNGTVATGSGVLIFRDAVVKFATGSNPYGNVRAEGNYNDAESNGVTTRTYTIPGDVAQGNNVALLVETERYFATLSGALNAASSLTAETVQLVADTDEAAITIAKDVTIDLGGFKAFTEISVSGGDVLIKNGTVASADANAITVTGGNVTLNGVTVASTANALTVNGAVNVNIVDAELTGDSDGTNDGYALNVLSATAVEIVNGIIKSGAGSVAPINVDNTVPYEVVTLTSGEVYVPKAYYEANLKWAQGQDKIVTIASDSRHTYKTTIENDAANFENSVDAYVVTASAPAAMIGKIGYATLKDAVAAAGNMTNATIVLMRDVYLGDEFPDSTKENLFNFTKTMTIDFNGFTVYCQGTGAASSSSIFLHGSSSAVITYKNGTLNNLNAVRSYTLKIGSSGGNVVFENMYVISNKSIVYSTSSSKHAHVQVIGSTLESTGTNAVNFARSGTEIQPNLRLAMSNGSKLIGASNGLRTNVCLDYANIECFNLDDAYIYAPAEVEEYAQIQNAKAPYMEDEKYVYYFSSTGNPAAMIGNESYFSLADALNAANSGDTVIMQRDFNLQEVAEVKSNVTLDLNGKTLSFGSAGALNLSGTIATNGGKLVSNGNVVVKNGATIDGYTYNLLEDTLLNTALNLKAVSLSLNEYVDINLKYSESDLASFNSVKVIVNGGEVAAATPANGLAIYKVENLKASDYATTYTAVMSANSGNTACVGMPAQVSVKEYAKKVVADTTNYGYGSELGKTMTAMMDYANIAAEFTGSEHANTADFGTTAPTTDGVLSVAGDFSNGFALKVTSTTAGKLTVAHTDVYGNLLIRNFDVTDGETVVYDQMHIADAKQTVTVTLMVGGNEASKLETTLASAANGADKAIIVSNHAEKLFTGR